MFTSRVCGAYWLPDGHVGKGVGCMGWRLSGLLALAGGQYIHIVIKATILLRLMWE